jgi:hypothetical protein
MNNRLHKHPPRLNVLLALGCMAGAVGACGRPTQTEPLSGTRDQPTSASIDRRVRSMSEPPDDHARSVRAWVDAALQAAEPGDEGCYRVLSEPEISFVMTAGYDVVPELMTRLRDARLSAWRFHFPASSLIQPRNFRVGELACYLIEAILRQNPYFTMTAQFRYVTPDDLSGLARERYSLDQAAAAYESWYEECFDPEKRSTVCQPSELPVVEWDYDLEAWPRFLSSGSGIWERIWERAGLVEIQNIGYAGQAPIYTPNQPTSEGRGRADCHAAPTSSHSEAPPNPATLRN